MELFIWSLIFVVSLAALVKAASWIAASVQKLIGGDAKSGFAIAVIAAVLPEMAAAVAAVLQARPELAIAIIIGSSLANILLVVGISAVAAKNLSVKEDHLGSDLPFFAASARSSSLLRNSSCACLSCLRRSPALSLDREEDSLREDTLTSMTMP